MALNVNHGKLVRYELMHGRDATEAIRAFPAGYLPIGCLERHGDHLPMGLDVIKAHGICCLAAQSIGGVVFPPHFYAGIHKMKPERLAKTTGEWGNLYTDLTARDTLVDLINQIAMTGLKALVLYTGHYPGCQVEMVKSIAEEFAKHETLRVVPFAEPMMTPGDHAGISETSLLLYIDRRLVDMTRIGEVNYKDHGWRDENSPEKATCALGEEIAETVVEHLRKEILGAVPELGR